jgi:hypothetical protein
MILVINQLGSVHTKNMSDFKDASVVAADVSAARLKGARGEEMDGVGPIRLDSAWVWVSPKLEGIFVAWVIYQIVLWVWQFSLFCLARSALFWHPLASDGHAGLI